MNRDGTMDVISNLGSKVNLTNNYIIANNIERSYNHKFLLILANDTTFVIMQKMNTRKNKEKEI